MVLVRLKGGARVGGLGQVGVGGDIYIYSLLKANLWLDTLQIMKRRPSPLLETREDATTHVGEWLKHPA